MRIYPAQAISSLHLSPNSRHYVLYLARPRSDLPQMGSLRPTIYKIVRITYRLLKLVNRDHGISQAPYQSDDARSSVIARSHPRNTCSYVLNSASTDTLTSTLLTEFRDNRYKPKQALVFSCLFCKLKRVPAQA